MASSEVSGKENGGFLKRHGGKTTVGGVSALALFGFMWDQNGTISANHNAVLEKIDEKHELQTTKMDGIRDKIEEAFSLYIEKMGENGAEIHVIKVRMCGVEKKLGLDSGECKK